MTWQRGLMVGCFAVATVLLWEDHESQFLSVVPYLLLLACPLLHLSGHRGQHQG
jgi:hypothetical protein